MQYVVPSYYQSFACLMGACRHSCCVGWEIDIDEESLARYMSIGGKTGESLKKHIDRTGEVACFRLTEDERCPFLNRDGLCDLIIAEGEDILCQICADHPRFRNFFSDRTEIGLGLCCEAAGRLILTHTDPVQPVVIDEDGFPDEADEAEQALTALRDRLTVIMQNRAQTVSERVSLMLDTAGIALPETDYVHWADVLLSLERLDSAWTDRLAELKRLPCTMDAPASPEWEIAFEQLMVYLLFRHLPAALIDGDIAGRIAYSALMWRILRRLCAVHMALHGGVTIDDLIELCRLYSSEIEYSDENITAILDALNE